MDENKQGSGVLKIIIIVIAVIVFLIAIGIGSLLYVTRYKVAVVDTQQSPDGIYELELQSIGEPYFPFGDTPGRLVLRENGTVISRTKFEIADDGAVLSADAWNVIWQDDCVEIILSGSEQSDELYKLYYDGQVDAYYGIDYRNYKNENENNTSEKDTEEATEQELFSGQWQIEDGYLAIYELLADNSENEFEVYYGASESSTRCIISENENSIEYLVYDRESQNGLCGLYVYYHSTKNDDGTYDYTNGVIIDIYAYVYGSGDVISSGKIQWDDIGSESYQKATGET